MRIVWSFRNIAGISHPFYYINFQRDDINEVADIWLDTNIRLPEKKYVMTWQRTVITLSQETVCISCEKGKK